MAEGKVMELPQSIPLGNEGRNSACEFLSLYSAIEMDSRPPQGCLKTHDFLRPLDICKKEDGRNEPKRDEQLVVLPSSSRNSFPSTSHISVLNQTVRNMQKNSESFIQLPERDEEASNCSSFSGSGFVLWDDSSARKENNASGKIGQWIAPNSSTRCVDFNSVSSSMSAGKHNLSFMKMVKSSHGSETNVIKKEASSFGEELSVQLDRRCKEQKANTPRSKHSATEQRRRSKINDRFVMLRDLIPHGDQKRDKASFLLEVIEYIQFLQEKLRKYEASYRDCNHEQKECRLRHAESSFDVEARAINEACIPIPISSADSIAAKEQEMLIQDGTINISSPYSQGLLNSLTLALQKSGVDLSQASISVQVNLGDRSDGIKDMQIQTGPSQKRLKMSRKHMHDV